MATGRVGRAAALAIAVLATACAGRPGPFPREGGDVSSEGGAPSIVPDEGPDPGPGDAADDAGDAAAPATAGSPCSRDDDCATGFCMTTSNIGAFIPGAVVTNGYCSALFCAVDGSDGTCTAAMGGTCFSLFPFLGESFGDQGICLAPCTADADCRTADDDRCFDAQELVDLGLVDASVVERYYPDVRRACLPDTVAQAAIDKLTPH